MRLTLKVSCRDVPPARQVPAAPNTWRVDQGQPRPASTALSRPVSVSWFLKKKRAPFRRIVPRTVVGCQETAGPGHF